MMTYQRNVAAIFLTAFVGVSAALCQEFKPTIDWQLTHLNEIGGHKPTIVGTPRLVDSESGTAIEFDGQSALFLDTNPIAGLTQFTAEVIFQPTARGGKEQRFVHMQEDGSENRLLFELRLTDD